MIIDAVGLFKKRKAAILLQKRKPPKGRKLRAYEDELEVQRAVKAVEVEKQKVREAQNVRT